MRVSNLRPRRQLFVCTNARAAEDPLRSGCGAVGPKVFLALKSQALRRGLTRDLWITASGCLGHCPAQGCSVVLHPANRHLIEVEFTDVAEVLQLATQPPEDPQS
jgi:predicted metal-binding protein